MIFDAPPFHLMTKIMDVAQAKQRAIALQSMQVAHDLSMVLALLSNDALDDPLCLFEKSLESASVSAKSRRMGS